MIEKPRAEFLKVLSDDSLPAGQWKAIVLAIPSEWLHSLGLSQDGADQIIGCGAEILSAIYDGIYARIGWCSYFAVSEKPEHEIRSTLAQGSAFNQYQTDIRPISLRRLRCEPMKKQDTRVPPVTLSSQP
jgi:hypothetical protein